MISTRPGNPGKSASHFPGLEMSWKTPKFQNVLPKFIVESKFLRFWDYDILRIYVKKLK